MKLPFSPETNGACHKVAAASPISGAPEKKSQCTSSTSHSGHLENFPVAKVTIVVPAFAQWLNLMRYVTDLIKYT